MDSKKDIILNNLTMKEVLDEYGIKTIRNSFCCPFHNDKTPSATCYEKNFFCFACGTGGDIIQFVESYFNISFLDALEKINQDFHLNIPSYRTIDKKEIEKMQLERLFIKQQKQKQKQEKKDELLSICRLEHFLKKYYKELKENINPYNWEETEEICAFIEFELMELDFKFNKLNVKD